MATDARNRRKAKRHQEEQKPKGDLASLAEHIQENPIWYAAGVAFVLLAIIAGVVYRQASRTANMNLYSAYAKALNEAEPEERYAALAEVAESGSDRARAEVIYMRGETAFQMGDFEKAREAFEKVRSEYRIEPFVSQSLDGLGAIAEAEGEYEVALRLYREITQHWPDSFIGLRQLYNIGRVQEELANFEEAIAAYQDQISLFAGSHAARRSGEALERLRASHPDLFPETIRFEDMTDEGIQGLTDETVPALESPEEDPAASGEDTPRLQLELPDLGLERPAPDEPETGLQLTVPEDLQEE
jgi:tetratricopeptide (TPR) repeat protein